MMTLVVTRNALDRTRGFLSSVMLEVAPGVYVDPRMTAAVRQRVWEVMKDWFEGRPDEAVLMTWPDTRAAGGQRFLTLGSPRVELYEHDGMVLVRNELTKESWRSLKREPPGEGDGTPSPGGSL